jgi:hypothetical protein
VAYRFGRMNNRLLLIPPSVLTTKSRFALKVPYKIGGRALSIRGSVPFPQKVALVVLGKMEMITSD